MFGVYDPGPGNFDDYKIIAFLFATLLVYFTIVFDFKLPGSV